MASGRKHVNLPRTKAACQKLWDDASTRKLAKGYLTVAGNTDLYLKHGVFKLYFHNHCIVEYHDEFKVVNACGWSGSPTTQGRIASATGTSMFNNSSLGYEQITRIEGYPYFDGIRVDNYGQVLEEDRRPDFKTVNKKAVVNAYTTLFRRIEKLICGRYDLGEWKADSPVPYTVETRFASLLSVEKEVAAGETFLSRTNIHSLLSGQIEADLRSRLTTTKENLRAMYYTHNDGYERIEIK